MSTLVPNSQFRLFPKPTSTFDAHFLRDSIDLEPFSPVNLTGLAILPFASWFTRSLPKAEFEHDAPEQACIGPA
jgi:hypothetical protein